MNIFFFALLSLAMIWQSNLAIATDNLENDPITPHKYTDSERESNKRPYTIPISSRFTLRRLDTNAPDIVYYLSKPEMSTETSHYPIAILCGGSSTKEDIWSIIHFHRYFLKEFMGLGACVLTVEQWGVDGQQVNEKDYIENYTRSQRLKDHKSVIGYLKSNPPTGWNGKLIFLGVSEGGPLVIKLTENYPDITLATMNWSGAGDWSWFEELWLFMQNLLAQSPDCPLHQLKLSECQACLASGTTRDGYDACMDEAIKDPTAEKYFLGMTYKYHADAQNYPGPDYQKIRTPFLVVAGTQDTILQSSDAFVEKARSAGVLITYFREDMDHYIREKPDIIKKSFDWLEGILKQSSQSKL